jgi:acetoin utilization deacetylase AcuC-like enzyme
LATLLIEHPIFLEHEMPPGHPERVDRIRVVTQALAHPTFDDAIRRAAPKAEIEATTLVHDRRYVDIIVANAPTEGFVQLDADTFMSPGTLPAALHAVGGACLAVDEVMRGSVANAFCAIRPPGHHAESDSGMGFCIFNNVAIAARHAQKKHGLPRVAIMDFDVHHGNGSQEIFWSYPTVMYCSTHQMPLYPGTGARDERGAHDNIVNAPLRSGDGGTQFKEAMESVILPRMHAFGPDLVIISAGFDAHANDPLGGLNFVEDDFSWATGKLMELAQARSQGRVISVLEGGYDLEGLSKSVAAHVSRLMNG